MSFDDLTLYYQIDSAASTIESRYTAGETMKEKDRFLLRLPELSISQQILKL